MTIEWVWNGEHLDDCCDCGRYRKVDDDDYCEDCFEVEEWIFSDLGVCRVCNKQSDVDNTRLCKHCSRWNND